MATASTAFTLKDAGFFLKNVPNDFDEWDLFEVFAKIGRVGYCRIGGQAVDKLSKFAFVNMLTVRDADCVRDALNDGCLRSPAYNIQVNDVKNDSANAHMGVVKQPLVKFGPIKIPSTWLPVHQVIEVQVVDHLPCSSINNDTFTVTLIRTDDKTDGPKYKEMTEKIGSFSNLTKFDGECEIGFDFIHKISATLIYRARRISATKAYLLDEGKIIAFDKTRCYYLPKMFAILPTRVAMCGLYGLKWEPMAIPTFDKIREVVKQWGDTEPVMYTKTNAFSGTLNMIELYSRQSVLATRLERKGACKYTPYDSQPSRKFSRDDMLKLKTGIDFTPKISTDKDVIEDLVKKTSKN